MALAMKLFSTQAELEPCFRGTYLDRLLPVEHDAEWAVWERDKGRVYISLSGGSSYVREVVANTIPLSLHSSGDLIFAPADSVGRKDKMGHVGAAPGLYSSVFKLGGFYFTIGEYGVYYGMGVLAFPFFSTVSLFAVNAKGSEVLAMNVGYSDQVASLYSYNARERVWETKKLPFDFAKLVPAARANTGCWIDEDHVSFISRSDPSSLRAEEREGSIPLKLIHSKGTDMDPSNRWVCNVNVRNGSVRVLAEFNAPPSLEEPHLAYGSSLALSSSGKDLVVLGDDVVWVLPLSK